MSDRLERDVEDVLDQIEDFEWHRANRRRPSKARQAWNGWTRSASDAIGRRLARFTAGHLMLVGFLILLAGVVFRFRGIGTWFVLVGVIFFLLGLFLNMRGSPKPSGQGPAARGGYWRDRYITYGDRPSRPRRWLRRTRDG
ncbi:MAG TPA: hypothetical protein QGF05_00295 [Dehalococcoidia bacterium]|nr:hypothetical protein [Dehalococcoidia bacterium]